MNRVGMRQEGTIRDMIYNSMNQYKDCALGILQENYLKNEL